MRNYRSRFSLLLIILILAACTDKKETTQPIAETNEFILPDPPQYGTPLADIPATGDIVMYEVNIRAFSPANFEGVINRLDQIKLLGVNVIWLMPVFPIGTINSVNSPYSVKDYRAVNSEFGSLSDLRDLIDQAHQRGMAVILDWVANHTAWDNPWMKYPSWYTRENGVVIHPAGTNWLDVADLDFNSTDMKKAMISAMKYWIFDANIDGFRCDAADMVPYGFWKQAIDSLNNIPGRDIIMLAEGARYDHYTAGFQLNFAWDFYGELKSVFAGQPASGLISYISGNNGIPTGKYKLRFTTNHDESAWDATPVTLFGGIKGALAAQVIAIFSGGVPLIYGSQEVGRASTLPFFSNSPIDWTANPDMLLEYQNILSFYTGSSIVKSRIGTAYTHNDIIVFTRRTETEELAFLVNVRNNPETYSLQASIGLHSWQNVLSGALIDDDTIAFEAYEYLILSRAL